ncbi:MAG: YbaB/EbfC family nucleoid-associated protein [Elusimicrobiota bacterium]|jgi:DNA-binding protein YbaB|nr:YbaB/EbfC family nucleoid-associated protein [Elusimicrobiota bacterium]
MFDKLKDLVQLKKKMAEVKKRLDAMVIKVESPEKFFELTISGSQEVKELKIIKDIAAVNKETLEKDLIALFNKSVRDSQAMAAQAMGDIAGLGGGVSA